MILHITRPSKNKEPNMSLQVKLDRNILWHPGDVIAGVVVFRTLEQANVQNIWIEFEGRLRTRETRSRGNQGSVTYKGKVTLFHKHLELFRGPYTLPPSAKEWPFEFRLPVDCRHADPRHIHDMSRLAFDPPAHDAQYMNLDTSQALPPTMNDGNLGLFTSRKECYASYFITAKWEPTSFFKGTRESFTPLNVEPYREESEREPKIGMSPWSRSYLIKSYYLDPDHANRSLTFKEHMKSSFGSKDVPEARFKLNIQCPDTIISGQRLPVLVGTATISQGGGKKGPLEVSLISYKATLTKGCFQMTHRGGGLFNQNDHVTTFDSDMPIEVWNGNVHLGGGIDLRELPNVRVARPPTPPSFRSFIISRLYALKIEGEVECAQQKNKFQTFLRSITILPRECEQRGGLPQISDAPAYVAKEEVTLQEVPEEQLPSYKAATNEA